MDEGEEEKDNAYREAALRILPILQAALGHCLAAKTPEIGLAQLKFAFGIEERSMHDVAPLLGITPQCLSRGAKEFVRDNNLPTPPCMKSEAASESFRNARNRQLLQP
jgi:hypothetical protein